MGDEAAENLRLMIEFAKRGQVPQIEGFLEEQVPINGVDHLGCTGTVSSHLIYSLLSQFTPVDEKRSIVATRFAISKQCSSISVPFLTPG
jgi:hypothetical protein